MDLVLSRMVEDAISEEEFRKRFEKMLREQCGFEYGIAMRSPYDALSMALRVCGLSPMARIGLSALAPQWHKTVAEELGFIPIILDVDTTTLHPTSKSIDEAHIAAAITYDALGSPLPDSLLRCIDVPLIEDITATMGQGFSTRTQNAHFQIWGFEVDSAIATGGGAFLCTQAKEMHRYCGFLMILCPLFLR